MPVTTLDFEKVDEPYTKLFALIDAGEEQQALDLLNMVRDRHERLTILMRAGADNRFSAPHREIGWGEIDFARESNRDLALAIYLAWELNIANDTARARTRARSLASAQSLASLLDLRLARKLEYVLVFKLDLDLTRSLVVALNCALGHARFLDHIRNHAYKQVPFIIKALEKEVSAIQSKVKRVRIENPLEPQTDGEREVRRDD